MVARARDCGVRALLIRTAIVLPSAALLACTVETRDRTQPPATDHGRVIAALEERLTSAMVASDTATLARLWADEYRSTSAVGHTSTRAEALMAYTAGLVQVDSAAVQDLDVRSYGNAAVSLGYLHWAGTAAGTPFVAVARFQHVWIFSDTAWRLVASQMTNQPPR
jgi:hypothetical protein